MKGKKHTEESKSKMSLKRKGKYLKDANSFYGKHHTKESKLKMGQPHSKDAIKKMKNSAIGKHNGVLNGMYGTNHSKETISKLKEKQKDRHWIQNGAISKRVKSEDLQLYLIDGRKKGRIL